MSSISKQAESEMEIFFSISESMVEHFAQLTSDRNSLHMDEHFARKSKYRQRIVHGMLPFSFLTCIQSNFPGFQVQFLEFNTSFKEPIFLNDEIKLEITYREIEETYLYAATWYRTGCMKILIKSKGKFHLIQSNIQKRLPDDNRKCFVLDEISEHIYTIHDLAEKKHRLNITIDSGLTDKYKELILEKGGLHCTKGFNLCENLISTLLLSTLVGMKLPGKYATFTKFKFSFQAHFLLQDVMKLVGRVEKVSFKTEAVEVGVTLQQGSQILAEGQLGVMVNPPPKLIISCHEIQSHYLEMGLKNKVVVITGASRGIGAATAKLFAMQGAKVVVHYYQGQKDAEMIVEEIKESGGVSLAAQCDIRDELQVEDFTNTVVENFGTVDILVNNAVSEAAPKNFMQLEWPDYLKELEVSLKGMHNCCKAIIPIFKEKQSGKIINLSTIFVDSPVTGQNKYITVKSAVAGYTKSLAKELADKNIQVNWIVPNMTETDLIACIPSEFSRKIAAERVAGRNLEPVEVAQSIVFLSSSWANSITGQKIVLNLGELPYG